MSKNGLSVAHFKEQIVLKEQELLLQQEEVAAFVNSPHTSKDTEEYQAAVRKADIEINNILQTLLQVQKPAPSAFRIEAEKLCQRCRDLKNYTRDMKKDLADDLVRQHHLQDEKKINLIEIGGAMLGLPFTLAVSAQTLFKTNGEQTKEILEAGFAVGTVLAFHEKISAAFVAVGRTVCATPRLIKNSFLLYYATEMIKRKGMEAGKFFEMGATRLTKVISLPQRKDKDNGKPPEQNIPEP